DIRQSSTVRWHSRQLAQLPVALFQLDLLPIQVVTYQRIAAKLVDLGFIQEADGTGIDAHRPLDAATTRLKHVTPVPEAFRKQLVRGDGGNSLVPVLNFDSVQGHIDDESVRPR